MPSEFFHRALHHLALSSTNYCSFDDAQMLLKRCKGVVDFASMNNFVDPTLLPVLAERCVRRLALCLHDLFGESINIDLSRLLFVSITHLDLFDTIEDNLTQTCTQIPLLPVLTHLSLDCKVPREVILTVLKECPQLELLLVLWLSFEEHAYKLVQVPHVYDVRFVIALCEDHWGEWEAGAKGLPNFWSRAEKKSMARSLSFITLLPSSDGDCSNVLWVKLVGNYFSTYCKVGQPRQV
jgi:hypothetical protein